MRRVGASLVVMRSSLMSLSFQEMGRVGAPCPWWSKSWLLAVRSDPLLGDQHATRVNVFAVRPTKEAPTATGSRGLGIARDVDVVDAIVVVSGRGVSIRSRRKASPPIEHSRRWIRDSAARLALALDVSVSEFVDPGIVLPEPTEPGRPGRPRKVDRQAVADASEDQAADVETPPAPRRPGKSPKASEPSPAEEPVKAQGRKGSR
jgi:hypothetical protein